MLEFIGASAIAGALAKMADDYQDRGLKLPLVLALLIALLYGLILGALSSFTILSSLFLALAIANILTQKIDGIHIFALCVFASVIIYSGISYFNPFIFSLFLVSGLLDELALARPKFLVPFFENRLTTPLFALFTLLYFQEPVYLIVILSFDILYKLTDYFIGKQLKK